MREILQQPPESVKHSKSSFEFQVSSFRLKAKSPGFEKGVGLETGTLNLKPET
jgi:hypothetical protein